MNCLMGAFCIACALFCKKRRNKGQFVNRPFTAWWHKRTEKCKEHELTQYHQESLQQAEIFTQAVEHPTSTVSTLLDKKKAANIERNRTILKCVLEAVIYCGRQCIALRGDNEKLNESGNPGNVLSLLKLMANHNEIIRIHLEAPQMKCVTFMSPQTQNELLEFVAKHIILQGIVQDIKQARFYSIMADEVTSHNSEQMAICVRFVDSVNDIREEFLQFSRLARITGKHIAEEIVKSLEDLGIPVEDMRGQGYDGASNMSSQRVGVQARIREKSPLATYIHCSGHYLNLVIAHSCALPEVRNVLDKLKNSCRFFQKSPKRNGLLELVVSKGVGEETKRKALLDLCRTRWALRHKAYLHFYQAYNTWSKLWS